MQDATFALQVAVVSVLLHATMPWDYVMSDFMQMFESKVDAVPAAMMDRMREAGFKPYHTGGGCMAWHSVFDGGPEIDDAYFSITNEDLELHGDPKEGWVAGRYADDAWIAVGNLSLDEALGVVRALPAPSGEDYVEDLAEFEARFGATTPSA